METFPILKTNRLNLIEITQTHGNDILNLYSNEEVTRFYNILPLKSIQESHTIIDYFKSRYNGDLGIRWGITLKSNTKLIGTLGFNNILKHHKASIGYELHPNYWRNGYMTEALNAIINFGFNDLAINRIDAEIMVDNIASEKVLSNINFEYEGILKQWMYWNNHYYDMKLYALLRSEFNKSKNTTK